MGMRLTKSNDDRVTIFDDSDHTSREPEPGWHRMIGVHSIMTHFFELPYVKSTFIGPKQIVEVQTLVSV